MGKKQTWKREVKDTDSFLANCQEGDLIIPVMGPTGVGKSTFINKLIGENVASVGHNLQSHTSQINHYFLKPSNPRIIILDTPGFNDTDIDDREILRRIAVWLARSYDADMKLAGIVYLHEITQTRMLGSARTNLDMFQKLCGVDAAKNVILATTKWQDVKPDVGKRREQQLRDEHWTAMLSHGSRMKRFENTKVSADSIVREIRARKAVDAVQIQDELVVVDKMLAETEAGRTLRFTLKELLDMQKRMASQLRQEDEKDADLQEKVIENDRKIRSLMEQIKGLNIPLSRKIKRFFGLA